MGILCLGGAIALVRDTAYQGQDFEVFWLAARAILDGISPYRLESQGGMIFKYPPWILPAFLPFAFFSLEAARWLWGFCEIFSLFFVVFFLFKKGISFRLLFFLSALFWGIWAVHALDGQVELPLLALCLWAWKKRKERFPFLVLVWALTAKVFTVFALLGLRRNDWTIGKLIFLLITLTTLTLPALWITPEKTGLILVQDWMSAAGSGGEMLAGEKVRGRENQGLPALIMRLLIVPAADFRWDLLVFTVLALVSGFCWIKFTKHLPDEERWFGSLALSAALHPLAWIHLFVFTFPLVATAVSYRFPFSRTTDQLVQCSGAELLERRVLLFIGISFITVISRNTLGTWGLWLELASVRALGVICLCFVLVNYPKKSKLQQ